MPRWLLRPSWIEWPEYWLGRFFSWSHWEDHVRAWQLEARRAFIAEYSPCPSCGQSVEQHTYARLAQVVRRPEASAAEKELRAAIARRAWETAVAIREGDHGEDLLQFELVHCPNTGDVGLYEVIAYHELAFDDAQVSRLVLAPENAAQVLALLPLHSAHWNRFSPDA